MKKLLYSFFIFFFFQIAFAQNNPREKEIEKLELTYKRIKEKNESTHETITELKRIKAEAIKIGYNEGALKYNLQLVSHYIKRADYNDALRLVSEIETLAKKTNDYKSLSILYGRTSEIQNTAGHYEEAIKEAHKSLSYAEKITDPDRRAYQISFASMQLVAPFEVKNKDSVVFYAKNALEHYKKIDDANENLHQSKYGGILFTNMYLGSFYATVQNPPQLDIAEQYYLQAYDFKNKQPEIFEIYDLSLITALGIFYQEKGEYEKAVSFAKEALEIEKIRNKPDDRVLNFMTLSNAYEKLKKTDLQLQYTKKYTLLSDSLNEVEKRTHEELLKEAVNKTKTEDYVKQKRFLKSIVLGLVVLAIGVWILIRKKNKKYHKKYEDILLKLQTEKQNILPENHLSDINNKISVNGETEQKILLNLEDFERSEKFLQKEITIGMLSTDFSTNPKYLSEVIKTHKSENFNQYINNLRVNYIVHKLYNDAKYREYKISYLAEEAGFASRQVFVLAFKKMNGVTPSYFIQNLKKEEV